MVQQQIDVSIIFCWNNVLFSIAHCRYSLYAGNLMAHFVFCCYYLVLLMMLLMKMSSCSSLLQLSLRVCLCTTHLCDTDKDKRSDCIATYILGIHAHFFMDLFCFVCILLAFCYCFFLQTASSSFLEHFALHTLAHTHTPSQQSMHKRFEW